MNVQHEEVLSIITATNVTIRLSIIHNSALLCMVVGMVGMVGIEQLVTRLVKQTKTNLKTTKTLTL